jgi:TolB-like protein
MKKMAALCLYTLLCAGAVRAKDQLAVLPFTGGTGREGETIAELFSFNNELNEVFSPIPRTSIAHAIDNEQAFQTSTGMTDPDTIAAIGKQLGARYVVAGNIAKLGNRNLLIISIIKIDDLRQISGDIQTYTKIEEIEDKLPEMARNIITAAKREPSGAEKLAVVPVEMDDTTNRRVADTLAQILSINIIRSGKYLVYPRTGTLAQVQAEHETQLSGLTADESVIGIGKGDNPRFVLSVGARQLGSRNMFNASIINLETGVQIIGRSVNYDTLDDGIKVMQTLAHELTGGPGDTGLGGGKKPADGLAWNTLGRGALNLALGLGSFLQKDWAGGGVILAGYGAAAGLIAWELSLSYEDPLAGVPGTAGLAVAGAAVVYGFVRPFVYRRSPALAGIVDGIHLAVVPENRGGAAVRLSYTLRF